MKNYPKFSRYLFEKKISAQNEAPSQNLGGLRSRFLNDVYHYFMATRWWTLLVGLVLLYLTLNLIFASLYFVVPGSILNARPGSYLDVFFFSAQTLATVGYGVMSPNGGYANVVASTEAFFGLLSFALGSGLMFAKFSRPTAKVLFSDVAVIGIRDGALTLSFRMANGRSTSQVIEANIHATLIKFEKTQEGENFRRLYDLELVRDRTPSFFLSWTAMHRIDSNSPLYGETPESLANVNGGVFITFTGIEESFSQSVHARHAYATEKILFNQQFVDIMSVREDGSIAMDYSLFHGTKPQS